MHSRFSMGRAARDYGDPSHVTRFTKLEGGDIFVVVVGVEDEHAQH